MALAARVRWIKYGRTFTAELDPDVGWKFKSRVIGDTRSFPISPTPELIGIAEALLSALQSSRARRLSA